MWTSHTSPVYAVYDPEPAACGGGHQKRLLRRCVWRVRAGGKPSLHYTHLLTLHKGHKSDCERVIENVEVRKVCLKVYRQECGHVFKSKYGNVGVSLDPLWK